MSNPYLKKLINESPYFYIYEERLEYTTEEDYEEEYEEEYVEDYEEEDVVD